MDNIENIKKEYSKRINIFSTNFEELNDYQIEKIVEFSMCTNLLINFDEVLSWWNEKQTKFSTSIEEIPLEKMKLMTCTRKSYQLFLMFQLIYMHI